MKNKRKTTILILLGGIITIIGFGIWFTNFGLFEKPIELLIKQECDYEGLRKVAMYELNGNATANNSIQITASDCNYPTEIENSELIFSASLANIKTTDISFEWKSFDTLTIKYNEKLKIFRQKKESESVNPKIIFEYKPE
ncbi:hypothetical protein V8G69_11830 [Gaetbulibacter sp. M235]|uniref:hypothetical protein n=1 Tax=Gaetbulibacter sp. M235 TaxID=3126510 RepID=UPI00374E950A